MRDTSLSGAIIPTLGLAGLLYAGLGVAGDGRIGNTEFGYSGYVKLDVLYSDYSDGDVASGAIGRDYYYPATIPVNASPGMDDAHAFLDMTATATRFALKTQTDVDGEIIKSYIELDFQNSPGGNEVVSNSYNPRLRHAYLSWRGWLFGQTWSTFQNVTALPETLDFIGPAEATVFERQAMVRYTRGPWQFALENPETVAIPYGGGGAVVTDDNRVPDIVGRYNHRFGGGSDLVVAVIARSLAVNDSIAGVDDESYGYGISVSGTFKIGTDDIKWMLSHGDGLGRYLGIATLPGAVADANGTLQTIGATAGYLSYRHFWNARWRSTFVYGLFEGDADTQLTGEAVNASAQSLHANLLYSPLKPLTFGVELMHAVRELENGQEGSLDRLIFSAKYAF